MEKKTRKRPMKKLEKKKERSVSFSKRRYGLFNKAAELFMLCDAQLAVLVSSPCCSKPKRKIYSFGHPSVDVVLDAFLENHVPNAIDNKVKQYALSRFNEIKELESELKSITTTTCTLSNKNLENVGFSSIFEGFQKSESIEELQGLVDGLEKLIVKAKSRVRVSDPFSCIPSKDNGDGVLESLQFFDEYSSVTTNGFCSLNRTDYVSCSNINDTSPTSNIIDSNDVLTLQESAFGYNFDSNVSIDIDNNGNNNLLELPSINYNELKGKQVDCNIITNNVPNFGCVNGYNIVDGNSNSREDENWRWANLIDSSDVAANPYNNEPSADFDTVGTLDSAYQNVLDGNELEYLEDWLMF